MPSPQTTSRALFAWVGISLIFALACFLRLFIGSAAIGMPEWDGPRPDRLLAGITVGGCLAVAGVALQALLRNPLAEPFILGLSSGAGLGVILQLLITKALGLAGVGLELGAFAGALASMAIVLLAARKRGVIDPLGLLLTGVVLSTINGAIILFLNYIVGPGGLKDKLAYWMMGYIADSVTRSQLIPIAGLGLAITAGLLFQSRAMDISTLSDDEARSLGVNTKFLRLMLFISASALAALGVIVAGPISFIGLICPHVARMALGPRHAQVIPGSALLGASLVVMADTLSAFIDFKYNTGLVPLGVFTAILGGIAFLWMLRPQLGSH
jgi:iron complex transport system permease protein